MDLLKSLQAFKVLQDAKASKEERTKLAKDLGYSKDPLEMTLTEFANEAMKDSPSSTNVDIRQPLQEKDLLAVRMLQNLAGIGVLNPDTNYDRQRSPLQDQILKQYYYQNPDLTFVERKPIGDAPPGKWGEYIVNENQLNLNRKLYKRENLLNLLSTLAHESQHQQDFKDNPVVPLKWINPLAPYGYTDQELQALGNLWNGSFPPRTQKTRDSLHHYTYRNFDIEAPLYNEAQLALKRGEQIPEWMFNWQPRLLNTLNQLQQQPKTPVTEDQLIQQLFLTNTGNQ